MKSVIRTSSMYLHISAHLGLDFLFAPAAAVFAVTAIRSCYPEKNKKDGEKLN